MVAEDDLYTTSRLRAHARCARLHHYRYDIGIHVEEDAADRDFGTAGHVALEYWYRSIAAGDAKWSLGAALAAVDGSMIDEADRAKLRVLVRGYHARWLVEMTERYEVIGVEEQFRYELGGVMVGGKLDARVRDRQTGNYYVVEHKFTGANIGEGEFYWERLAIDTQCSIYIDGGSMLDQPIEGVIYDVIARPAHRPLTATPEDKRKFTQGKGCKFCGGKKESRGLGVIVAHGAERPCAVCHEHPGWEKPPRLYADQRATDESIADFEARLTADIAESPDAFFRRGIVVRLEHELPLIRRDLLDRVHLIRYGQDANAHPRNSDACRAYGVVCGYFPICSGRASLDDEHRFPRREAHPELAATNV